MALRRPNHRQHAELERREQPRQHRKGKGSVVCFLSSADQQRFQPSGDDRTVRSTHRGKPGRYSSSGDDFTRRIDRRVGPVPLLLCRNDLLDDTGCIHQWPATGIRRNESRSNRGSGEPDRMEIFQFRAKAFKQCGPPFPTTEHAIARTLSDDALISTAGRRRLP